MKKTLPTKMKDSAPVSEPSFYMKHALDQLAPGVKAPTRVERTVMNKASFKRKQPEPSSPPDHHSKAGASKQKMNPVNNGYLILSSLNDENELISNQATPQSSTSVTLVTKEIQLSATNLAGISPSDVLVAPENEEIIHMEGTPPLTTEKVHTPPPITMRNITNFVKISGEIQNICNIPAVFITGSSSTRINTFCPDDHRAVTKYLTNTEVAYNTRLLDSDKLPKCLIKGLDSSIPTEYIMEELEKEGITVTKVSHLKSFRAGHRNLPFFLIHVEREFLEKAKTLTRLCHSIVTVEPYRNPKGPQQCYRCLRFNHSAYNCRNPHNCVKCGLQHESKTCTKAYEVSPNCYSCEQYRISPRNHTANYRGCPVYQHILNNKGKGRPQAKPQQQQRQQQSQYISAPPPLFNHWHQNPNQIVWQQGQQPHNHNNNQFPLMAGQLNRTPHFQEHAHPNQANLAPPSTVNPYQPTSTNVERLSEHSDNEVTPISITSNAHNVEELSTQPSFSSENPCTAPYSATQKTAPQACRTVSKNSKVPRQGNPRHKNHQANITHSPNVHQQCSNSQESQIQTNISRSINEQPQLPHPEEQQTISNQQLRNLHAPRAEPDTPPSASISNQALPVQFQQNSHGPRSNNAQQQHNPHEHKTNNLESFPFNDPNALLQWANSFTQTVRNSPSHMILPVVTQFINTLIGHLITPLLQSLSQQSSHTQYGEHTL